MNIGSWNVRSLYRPGAYMALIQELERYKIMIMALQETRWPDKGRILKKSHALYYSGTRGRHEFDTGFLVHKQMVDRVMSFTLVNERICSIRIRGHFRNITIISVHAPTLDKSDEVKEEFYAQLEREYDGISRYDAKIIVGDFNAKVGQESLSRSTTGPHSAHDLSNENGLRLIDFAVSRGMVIASTLFPHKAAHKYTWRSPGGSTLNQIDHILVESRHVSSIMDVRTMRGADIDSDHFMIRMKYRARLAAKKCNIKSDTKRWNLKKLREAGVREKFEEAVASRLTESRLDGGEVEEKWIVLKTVLEEAACEVIGKQKSPAREEWFDEECMTAINKRNEARIRMLQCGTQNMKMEYARKRAAAKKITRKKKRLHDEGLLKEIELLSKKSAEVRNFYKKVNNKRNGYKAPAGICRDRSGKRVLVEPEQCLKEWTNYFEDLLNADVEMEENMSNLSTNQEDENNENNDDAPSLEEIIEAIGKIKRNKAAGIDDIPGELIKSGGMRMVTTIHDLVREV